MKTKILIAVLSVFVVSAHVTQAQPCEGFTTDPNDFLDVPAVDLLPEQFYADPQPYVRGGVEYSGQVLLIGTTCPGTYGVLSLCDFSSPVTGVPQSGTVLHRFGIEYWADVWINPFQLEIELQSGAVENFTATTSGGFVGFCAPVGETIVRVQMVGHDGTVTAIHHGDDSPVAVENVAWSTVKATFRP